MKKSILLLAILTCFNLFAQHEVAQKVIELVSKNTKFDHFVVLNQKNNISNPEINKVVDGATLAQINLDKANQIVDSKPQNIEIEIPFQGNLIDIQLYKVDIFNKDFHVDTNKAKDVNYQKGVYYRGIVKGDINSVACFNFFNNELNGIISSDNLSNLVVGKLNTIGNVSDYIIYKDENLKILNNFECHSKDNPNVAVGNTLQTARNIESARCVTVYFEIDYNLYQSNGNNTTTTTNWLTSVFNNIQTLYNNDGISVALKSLYIWTNQDPYEGIGSSSSDYLYKFNDVRPIFDGDVGQLVGIDPGGLGGVAVTINGLCSNNNFCYADVNLNYSTVPTYSWTIEVMTHELGHLLGSPHTHACIWNGNNTAIDNCAPYAIGASAEGYSCMTTPATIPSNTTKGTIMSYCHLVTGVGIKLSNGFGLQPRNAILNAVNSKTCLSTDCINTCINNITSISATNVTNDTANINWTEMGGTTTSQVSVYPLSATSGSWTTPSTNTFSVSGLTPNTYYKAVVRNNCGSGLLGPERSVVFATNGDFCSGILLTDTGGSSGNYQDFETIIRTIVPYNPSAKAKITFSSFDLELNYDYLYVYDGSDTSYPEVSGGGFTGNILPSPIESTATDGSLTIKFYSDGGVVNSGYEATVSCLTLGTNDFSSTIDFTYYPNPTNNLVTINSKTQMSEVLIYNPEGRLLSQQKINALNTKVDISSFAIGTYFFKLKFNDKELNFKILKM
jgi:hypothetical protein